MDKRRHSSRPRVIHAADRKWIYRSACAGVIVDIIWAMANQRAQVDESWFRKSRVIPIRGERLRLVPPKGKPLQV